MISRACLGILGSPRIIFGGALGVGSFWYRSRPWGIGILTRDDVCRLSNQVRKIWSLGRVQIETTIVIRVLELPRIACRRLLMGLGLSR